MRAAYLLAKLNARTQNFEILPISYQRFTASDVAHALGQIHVDDGVRALLRAKWVQQSEAMPILFRQTAAKALEELERYQYSALDVYELSAVISVAIQETVMPRLCKTCCGTGIVYQSKLIDTERKEWQRLRCWACEGEGHRAYSDRARARAAKMHKDHWSRYWAKPYADVILPILDNWERIGLRAINKRLQR